VTRTRQDVPAYKYHVPRTPDDIKQHVLNSDRVKYTVERVCAFSCINSCEYSVIQESRIFKEKNYWH